MDALQFFRGNGRAVIIGEKIFMNAGTGWTYLFSSEVPNEVTETLKTKTVCPGPGWQPISSLNPKLDEIEVGEKCSAWRDHIIPHGGCDILKRIA